MPRRPCRAACDVWRCVATLLMSTSMTVVTSATVRRLSERCSAILLRVPMSGTSVTSSPSSADSDPPLSGLPDIQFGHQTAFAAPADLPDVDPELGGHPSSRRRRWSSALLAPRGRLALGNRCSLARRGHGPRGLRFRVTADHFRLVSRKLLVLPAMMRQDAADRGIVPDLGEDPAQHARSRSLDVHVGLVGLDDQDGLPLARPASPSAFSHSTTCPVSMSCDSRGISTR